MVRDLPDYTREMVIRYTGGFIGLEELATRLGFVGPWDLRGNIILAENFESEETEYTLYAESVNSSATRSSRHKFLGDWAIKLDTGDVADEYTSLHANVVCPQDCKVAVFALLGFDYTVKEILIEPYSWDGSIYYLPTLRYRRGTTELAITDENGNYQAIDSALSLGQVAFMWYPFRLDFDLATGNYHKAYVAGQEYDLSGYAMEPSLTSGSPFIALTISNYAVAAAGCIIYLDCLVIAKNVQ